MQNYIILNLKYDIIYTRQVIIWQRKNALVKKVKKTASLKQKNLVKKTVCHGKKYTKNVYFLLFYRNFKKIIL